MDGVAVLRLDRPVANALAPDLRRDLLAALDAVAEDADVRAVVLAGAGAGFSSGVDLTEYEEALAPPWIGALCLRIENFPKPVVAALHGATFGAGFALALAAHARVARSDARLALPEISLGMMPGGGVTQRVPRLVGAQVALELMLSGQTVTASDGRLRRLFAQVTAQDPIAAAIKLATGLAVQGEWPCSCDTERGLSDPMGYQRAIAAVAEHLKGSGGAAGDILRAVEAAQLLPFAQGLEFEETLFEDRLRSPDARAQRHVYAAERRAGGMPELRNGQARALRKVLLRGEGLGDVALALIEAGRDVQSDAPDVPAAARSALEGMVKQGRIDEATCAARLGCLKEAGGEATADLELNARGAADTATGFVVPLDSGGGLAGARLGLRFYRPAHRLRLTEIAVSGDADQGRVASLARFCADLRCMPVRAAQPASGPGLGHVMMGALCLAALEMVRGGMTPLRVDQAALRLGLRAGPFLMMDQEGLPSVAERLRIVSDWLGCRQPGPDDPLSERLAKGAKGRAVGRGFYDHPSDGPRPPKGMAGPGRDPSDILGKVPPRHALHAALVGTALRLLERGAVQRASDIDVIMVRGYGYERAHGGPLFAADQRGLLALLNDMKALAPLGLPIWTPPERLVDMVKNGDGFFGRAAAIAAT